MPAHCRAVDRPDAPRLAEARFLRHTRHQLGVVQRAALQRQNERLEVQRHLAALAQPAPGPSPSTRRMTRPCCAACLYEHNVSTAGVCQCPQCLLGVIDVKGVEVCGTHARVQV
jgi:hypothetical protein